MSLAMTKPLPSNLPNPCHECVTGTCQESLAMTKPIPSDLPNPCHNRVTEICQELPPPLLNSGCS